MTDQRPLEVGYWMSSEEHPPAHLVEHAARAEAVGFRSAMISDHFHPWTARQGQGPFVWGVLGAIARATTELQLGTGVTAPILRVHPGDRRPGGGHRRHPDARPLLPRGWGRART